MPPTVGAGLTGNSKITHCEIPRLFGPAPWRGGVGMARRAVRAAFHRRNLHRDSRLLDLFRSSLNAGCDGPAHRPYQKAIPQETET